MEEIDSVLAFSLSRVIAEGPNAALTATGNAQPAIMATSILILRILEREFGFALADRVDFTLGHSLGEFAALVAGGYLQFADALYLVQRRAEVMPKVTKDACEEWGGEVGMVALICENEAHMSQMVEHVYDFIHLSSPGAKHDSAEDSPAVEKVTIANINSKNQIVLSGSLERINTLIKHLRSFGGHDPRHHRLKADSPFHTPLMKPAQEAMTRMLAAPSPFTGNDMITFPGLMPCISNVSAHPMKSKVQLKDHLARQCVETVYWLDSIRYLDREQKVRRWLGIGPGYVGRNLVGKEVGMKGAVKGGGVWGITSPKEIEAVVRALDETEQADED